MKTTHRAFLATTAAILVIVQWGAAQEKERRVAFKTSDGAYLTADTGNALNLSGRKVGSKQIFTLIDTNGTELADGHGIRVRYVPNSAGKPDPSKATYWTVTPEGIKRAKNGDVFKVKLVENQCAFQTPEGKFIAGPVEGGLLGITNAMAGALLMEPVDIQPKSPAPKTAKPATE
jgi:hypothetical protein